MVSSQFHSSPKRFILPSSARIIRSAVLIFPIISAISLPRGIRFTCRNPSLTRIPVAHFPVGLEECFPSVIAFDVIVVHLKDRLLQERDGVENGGHIPFHAGLAGFVHPHLHNVVYLFRRHRYAVRSGRVLCERKRHEAFSNFDEMIHCLVAVNAQRPTSAIDVPFIFPLRINLCVAHLFHKKEHMGLKERQETVSKGVDELPKLGGGSAFEDANVRDIFPRWIIDVVGPQYIRYVAFGGCHLLLYYKLSLIHI